MNKAFICDLSEGAEVDEVFFLQDTTRRFTRAGLPYLTMRLNDRSGIIGGRVWKDVDSLVYRLVPESFARIRGTVESYRNRLNINIRGAEPVDSSLLEMRDFLPGSYRDTEELTGYIRYFLTEVFDEDYSRLLESFFCDKSFMEKFCQAPGEERSHHAYLGGLLEHTVSVATLCQHVTVQHPRINSDLLITAALLHDIGKVDEFRYEGRISLSREGELLGHVLLGQKMIEQRISRLGGFPAEKELQLLHALVSHHGELEWGAPKRPQSAEALTLHHLDNLDAKVKGFYEVVDGRGDVPWDELQNLFRRPLTEPKAADR
ncbi:MAG: HD domain-containing protein [Thermoleophilia bacterium]|jgi:3'-5' exoribonuclease